MQPINGTISNGSVNPILLNSPNGRLLSSNSVSSELENVYKWIVALNSTETRETALLELCKKRESVTELAPLLWNSCGAIAALLQEICAIYPFLCPPRLTATQSNRVCNALALLQCLASHPETRSDFLKANIPLYLYTFLNTNNRNRPFEYLRLTSLGVIGALVKTDEPEVIAFLLSSEIIPLCLIIMESGTELSKTVATFIMQKMLLDSYGLGYICQTYQRFFHVATVLHKMVDQLTTDPSLRLLKHVVRCYLRLSDHSKARDALKSCLPPQLMDDTFVGLLEQDVTTKRWLTQLLRNLMLLPAVNNGSGGVAGASAGSTACVQSGNASSGTSVTVPTTMGTNSGAGTSGNSTGTNEVVNNTKTDVGDGVVVSMAVSNVACSNIASQASGRSGSTGAK